MAVATAVRSKNKEKTGNWSSIFPQEQLLETQSALFVKKLLAVAISNITYLRAIFPEHAFGDRCLEDLNLKILRDDSACPGACKLIKWVKGCFDALDKKYLRAVILGIFVDPETPESLIESYTFKFDYQNKGGMTIYRNDKKVASAYSESQTKKATIILLRTIIVLTQSLKSLPDNVFMTMKLLYYDDLTPADYEPPGFKAAESDKFNYDIEPMNIKVGDVQTNSNSKKYP
ncbi:HORMA domain-containing protein 1-like [Ptychodera flava]|uniref:HORMA domain-containing protein 1-like n=1 Tax=Ptychodera flava TaxID=63121 RepID=UPI00396A20C7